MLLYLLALPVLLAMVFAYHKSKKKANSSGIRVMYEPFHSDGNQVKPFHLMEKLPGLDNETLLRRGGWFEMYPNQKIVVLRIPPTTKIYCYCNLLEYLDLTRAIEKKMIYGLNPPARAVDAA